MQAYKLVCSGVYAIIMAEDDEAVMKKCFGHLDKTRVDLAIPGERKKVADGGLWRLEDDHDDPLVFIEVWTDEVKFIPPTGTVQ